MMVKEKLRLFGRCFDCTTSVQDTSMICFTEEKLSAEVRLRGIMQHFIWVFTVCQSTRLGVSGLQRVNKKPLQFLNTSNNDLFINKSFSDHSIISKTHTIFYTMLSGELAHLNIDWRFE